jgi:protein tyrosine phosphatase type 4A
MRFLITDRPTDRAMKSYIAELERYKASTLVRVCEPSYSPDKIIEKGIDFRDLEFDDGSPPPASIIDKWLQLCVDVFSDNHDQCIALHCVAGLGRSPVLVAIALLEAGLKCDDVIFLIRRFVRKCF